MPEYRLLALDLDGTLVDSRGHVPPAHRSAVQRARERGLEVVIATGRSWHEMADIYRELGLATPAITLSGCQVVGATGQILWERRMDPAAAARLVAWSQETGHSVAAVRQSGDAVATCRAPDFGPWEIWNRFSRVVGPLASHLADAPPLLMAVFGQEACRAAAPVVAELPNTHSVLWAPRPEEHVISLWHQDADKGRALADFCRWRGYRPQEVVAMGDAHIDIPMLTWAGVGVAMPGAGPEVRAAADMQVDAGDPHPVLTALERLGVLSPGEVTG